MEPRGRAVGGDGVAHQRYVDLLAAILTVGEVEEAALGWIQAFDIRDADDRRHELFGRCFPKAPAAAANPRAGSDAAYIERRLPLVRSKSAVDRLAVTIDLENHAGMAAHEVAGARRLHLIEKIDGAVLALARSKDLAIRDAVRLVRQELARSLAYVLEQP